MTVKHYVTRSRWFATEMQAEQFASAMELEGWIVTGLCQAGRQWQVVVRRPNPCSVAHHVAA